jgi:Protein phosphatase 2C
MSLDMNGFRIASGLSLGQSHQKLQYNCQDAYAMHQGDKLIVGVVADGCGAGRYSEVGARLGVQFALEFCKRNFGHGTFDAALLLQGMFAYLHELCDLQQASERDLFIEEHLLFTLVGFVSTPALTHVFYAGDGYIILNDRVWNLDAGNRPSYLGRHLLGEKISLFTDQIATADLHRLLIATDGLRDMAQPVTSLLDDDTFFQDERALPSTLQGWANAGILKDDAAVLMLKR